MSPRKTPATASTARGHGPQEASPVNVEDSTSPGTVEIPDHLLPALTEAAELRLETACDGEWDAEQRDRVVLAVHALNAVAAGTCTRAQVADLAARAAAMQGERM